MFDTDELNPQELLAESLVNETQDLLSALVELRKQKGMTQLEVADAIGITRTAITAFERYDADPKLSTILRYALAIGARISIDVEDGEVWARGVILREASRSVALGDMLLDYAPDQSQVLAAVTSRAK